MFYRKFRSNKGFTGMDIATAVTIIILTIGVVTAIYINTVNKSKENVRYSNATRIATQIIENIQAYTYEDLIYRCSNNLNNVDEESSLRKIFNVNVPQGYTAKVTAEKNMENEFDIERNVTVEIGYKISNKYKIVKLSTVKNRELLEQSNKPLIQDINSYYNIPLDSCYPIKISSGIFVTDESDPEWYNYDPQVGKYAMILYTNESLELGDEISYADNIFIWIPRFGSSNSDTNVTNENLAYAYGTSSYKITYSSIVSQKNDDTKLFLYTILYDNGITDLDTDKPISIDHYVDGTFKDNDGLTGVWLNLNMTDPATEYEQIAINSFNILNDIFPDTVSELISDNS